MSSAKTAAASELGVPDAGATRGRVMLAALRERMFRREDPQHIAHFVLRRQLGQGAHGSVYEAFDDRLQRSVAIKLLQSRGARSSTDAMTRRLIREAQALARLSHSNIVEVFEVGVDQGRVWLAMELVRGQDLMRWCAAHPVRDEASAKRSLVILLGAGAGLAAAHRNGVLHRDFKPANVLVGDDGRPRVADFGLARWEQASEPTTASGSSLDVSTDGLTRSGDRMGTPRYMSPEQIAGSRVDARSDQFNFAVAAWEVLTGAAPFVRNKLVDLSAPLVEPAIPRGTSVPRSVLRALQRALRTRPEARFATMDALLDAMRPRRRSRALTVGAVLVLGTVATTMATAAPQTSERPQCSRDAAAHELGRVWNASRRDAMQAGMLDTGLPYARQAAAGVGESLGHYGEQWTAQHVTLCTATWHDEALTPAQLDLGVACLRQQLERVDGLVTRLTNATPTAVQRAMATVESLPLPARCSGQEGSEPSEANPELRHQLLDAEVARLAGHEDVAEALAERVAALAEQAGDQRLLGDALALGGGLSATRREPRGYERLQRAHAVAVATGDDHAALRRAVRSARAAASMERYEDAHDQLRHASTALARFDSEADDRTLLEVAQCFVIHRERGSAAALQGCEQAVEMARDPAVDSTTRRDALSYLAAIYGTLGRTEEAQQRFEALRAEAAQHLGPGHPATARAIKNLALLAARVGDGPTAIEHMSSYVQLIEAALGPSDETLPVAYGQLGSFHAFLKQFDQAETAFQRGLQLLADHTALAPDKRVTEQAQLRGMYARMLRAQGKLELAATMTAEALFELQTVLPPGHSLIASLQLGLGPTLLAMGRYDEAEAPLAHAITWARDASHPRVVEALVHHAMVLEGQGRWVEAEAEHREAIVTAGVKANPNAVAARAHLAWIAARRGRPRDAESWIAAVAPKPDDRGPRAYAAAVCMVARAELREGEGDRVGALAELDAAIIKLDDDNPGAAQAATLNRARARRQALALAQP